MESNFYAQAAQEVTHTRPAESVEAQHGHLHRSKDYVAPAQQLLSTNHQFSCFWQR